MLQNLVIAVGPPVMSWSCELPRASYRIGQPLRHSAALVSESLIWTRVIRMMVKMRDPRPGERICDPAAGTCGFLVNAWQHLLETHTDPRDITYDEEGYPHGLTGSKLTKEEYEFSQTKALTGFDSDSGMTMLRIGSMNLMLHGISAPNFRYTDTLSKGFSEERAYDVVLANPPFKGAIDSADVNPTLPVKRKKTEILFLH